MAPRPPPGGPPAGRAPPSRAEITRLARSGYWNENFVRVARDPHPWFPVPSSNGSAPPFSGNREPRTANREHGFSRAEPLTGST